MVDHGYRHNQPPEITETEIVSVGSKYFRIACDERSKYHIESLSPVSDHTIYKRVYPDIQEYHDSVEGLRIAAVLRNLFFYSTASSLSLDQLKRMEAIVNEK